MHRALESSHRIISKRECSPQLITMSCPQIFIHFVTKNKVLSLIFNFIKKAHVHRTVQQLYKYHRQKTVMQLWGHLPHLKPSTVH